MMIEGQFKFDSASHALSGTSAVASTNVHDAGSAKSVFAGHSQRPPLLYFEALWVSGSSTLSIQAQFVGSDAATLDSNNIVIADTGTILVADDGTAFSTGHTAVRRLLPLVGQMTAKRYYGVLYTQGGTSPVFNVKAVIVADGQTNMPATKAAVPA